MRRIFLVHGMKRSGNHAIIYWVKAHDRFIFFNNIIPIAPILTYKKVIPPPQEFNLWLQQKIFPNNLKFAQFLIKYILQKHSFIISLEDHHLHVQPFSRVPFDITNILILRDPYNLFSSRIRKASLVNNPAYPKYASPVMDRALKLWKSHANEYLGLTNFLEHKVCIYFDSWFSNIEYRQNISRKLSLKFTDKGFHKVSKEGGGSSFNQIIFNRSNRTMDVLNRQRYLTDSEQKLLKKTLSDKHLLELAYRIRSS